MKKLKFSILTVAALGLVMASCKKEVFDSQETSKTNIVDVKEDNNSTKTAAGKIRFYYDLGGSNWGCLFYGSNCSPVDIVVTPSLIDGLTDAITSDNVKPFVSSNYYKLSSFFEKELLNSILNNVNKLQIKIKDDGFACLLFVNSSNENVEFAYPLITK